MQAPGIEYRTVVEGQNHFRCERLRAVIGVHECARRWQGANQRQQERMVICRRCSIGAFHASRGTAGTSGAPVMDVGVRRSALCVRCGRPATRLIWGELCPSCSNREAEWRRGSNGRGSLPILYRPPRPWCLGVVDAGGRVSWRMFVGQNFGEALARAARAGYRLHDGWPGAIAWNAAEGRFEYRDHLGRPLVRAELDGVVEFGPLARDGDVPARVTMPPMLATAEEATELLPVWLDREELSGIAGDWRQIDLVCRSCRSGVLHARRRGGVLECRCSAACC